MTKRCAVCEHKPSDHPDGIMGASTWTADAGERLLCHTDDHSCYQRPPNHARPDFGWDDLLDRPVMHKPRLAALFAEPSIFADEDRIIRGTE